MDSARFWLPPGVKWCRLNRGESLYLTLAPWVALGLLLLRYLMENSVLEPIGQALGIPDRCCSAPQVQPRLERVFQRTRDPSKEMMALLAKEIGWTLYHVQRWFWRARNYKKPSLLTKFKETGWRFLAYLCLVVYGLSSNLKEPCFWNQSKCYDGYPSLPPSNEILVYWACQLAFYCSLLVSQCKDIRRKDFYLMLVHHITTVALLGTGYLINMLQMSMLIALTHDISDVPLELAKILHYASCERLANLVFCVFAVSFLLSRLVFLPFWIIWSVYFDIPSLLGSFPAIYMITALLIVLQLMHLYWFKLIVSMAWELISRHKLQGDTRSDSELSDCAVSTTDYQSNGLTKKKTC